MDKERYGNRFLYSEDLIADNKYQSPTVEIEKVFERGTVASEKEEGKFINQRIIKFKGTEKLWGINVNIERIIHTVVGEPFGEKWVGKKIKLGVRSVKFRGIPTPAIRAIPPAGTTLRKSVIDSLGTALETPNATN